MPYKPSKRFFPKYKDERHKLYVKAFSINIGEKRYLEYFTRYILDSKMNPSVLEDKEVFRNLLLDSRFGNLIIPYCQYLVKNITPSNFDWTVNVMNKYLFFLGHTNIGFQADAFHYVFKESVKTRSTKHLIMPLLRKLETQDRLRFMEQASDFAPMLKIFPKIKLYLLFS